MYLCNIKQLQEVDLIEKQDRRLTAFEFKWNSQKKAKLPKPFTDNYPNTDFKVITPDNYVEFVNTTL